MQESLAVWHKQYYEFVGTRDGNVVGFASAEARQLLMMLWGKNGVVAVSIGLGLQYALQQGYQKVSKE